MDIVERILQEAKNKGISQAFICKKLGLTSRSYFTDIKKNNREIPEDKLEIIADILSVSVPYLKEEATSKEPVTNKDRLIAEAIRLMRSLEHDDMVLALDYLLRLSERAKK